MACSLRYICLLWVSIALSVGTPLIPPSPDHGLVKRQSLPVSPLVDFQVYEPVLTPVGPTNQGACVYTEVLMNYIFGFSYGKPFIGTYNPPPCSFNRVTINFTVTSRGRQFDRLGIMYLGDVEVFRTSTAEPTANGIIWSYIKEVDQYNALWKTPQKIIFDLGNLIDSTYTGSFDTTLTATFFTVLDSPPTADQILPISARRSDANQPSAFVFPGDNASVEYELPQNLERAVVSLSACGQATEEFWYTNVFQSEVNTFAETIGTLYGYSPFREVQLFIDGQLAGVSWPFPIIFTGGIAPGFWRPIVGIDAFDLRQQEIDITPWLPLLCDGASHRFEIHVTGISDDSGDAVLSGTTGSNWVITGTIFLFFDKSGSVTTGSSPVVSALRPSIETSSDATQNATGSNETLTYRTAVTRDITIASTINTSSGQRPVSWSQRLSYTNLNILSAQGFDQYTQQSTSGADRSSSTYASSYSYPLTVNSSFSAPPDGTISINATLSRGLNLQIVGPSIFPSGIQNFNLTSTPVILALTDNGRLIQRPFTLPDALPFFSAATLDTTQNGVAKYRSAGNASYSFGTTEQDFRFGAAEVGSEDATFELYRRHVLAVNSTVTLDEERLVGRTISVPQVRVDGEEVGRVDENGFSVRMLLGRGPGRTKEEVGGPGAVALENIETQ